MTKASLYGNKIDEGREEREGGRDGGREEEREGEPASQTDRKEGGRDRREGRRDLKMVYKRHFTMYQDIRIGTGS